MGAIAVVISIFALTIVIGMQIDEVRKRLDRIATALESQRGEDVE